MAQGEDLSAEGEGTAVGLLQEVQTPEQRGIAGPAGAQNGHHIAPFYLEIHILQDLQSRERLSDMIDFQQHSAHLLSRKR